MQVLCNSIGKHSECQYCGAAKVHNDSSCEPCPFIKDAKCIDPLDGAKLVISRNSILKLDKNFHVYNHQLKNTELLEISEDDKGRFLKIYFNDINTM